MARAGCIEFERGAGTPRVNAAPTKRIDFIAIRVNEGWRESPWPCEGRIRG